MVISTFILGARAFIKSRKTINGKVHLIYTFNKDEAHVLDIHPETQKLQEVVNALPTSLFIKG